MHDLETCSACRAQVVPRRPSLSARATFALSLVVVLAFGLAFPFVGFLWPFVAPVLVAVGMGLGPLVDAAFAPVTCPECERRFVPAPREGDVRVGAPAVFPRSQTMQVR